MVFAVFKRILDLHEFTSVLYHLCPRDRKRIVSDLGYLNVLNPFRPQFDYICRFRYHDDRVLTRALIAMDILELRDSVVPAAPTDGSVSVYNLYSGGVVPDVGHFDFHYSSFSKDKLGITPIRIALLKLYLVGTHGWLPDETTMD